MTALQGITVLDLTRVLSGPYCTMMLADLGARVIKVEQPGKGDDTRAWGPPFINGESSYFLSINRNKESVTLDFKQPDGRRILEQLIERADILVENFRPGTLTKVGFDYPSLASRFPRLIYASVSGFGHTGPRANEAGYDAVMQAEGGLMSITGSADGPPYRLGVAIADIVSGMFAAQGITAALFARERSGRGQQVDVAMFDSVIALLTYQAGIYFANGSAPTRLGNRHPTIVPYETFRASDGDFVVAVGNDEQWRRFCDVTGFAPDEQFATNRQRVTGYSTLKPALDVCLGRQPRDHWITNLKSAGVPCGSVRDLHEVFTDPQASAREMLVELEHAAAGVLKMTGTPMKLTGTPGSIRTPPPLLGEHTRSVLAGDLGLSGSEIDNLHARGVI